MFRKTIIFLVASFVAGNLAAQTRKTTIQDFIIRYEADNGSLRRFYSFSSGGQFGFDLSGGDVFPEKTERMIRFNKEKLQELTAIDFDALSVSDRVDYFLIKRNIDKALRLLDEEKAKQEKIRQWMIYADDIYSLQVKRRRGTSLDAQQTATTLNKLYKQVTALTAEANKASAMNMNEAVFAENTIKSTQNALKHVYDFYYGYDPGFTWWIPEPYKKLDSALKSYATVIKGKGKLETSQKDDGSGIIGVPIGHDELVRQLKEEFIPYTPEELIEIANKEFAWCDKEMLKASQEMGFGDKWKDAQEKVKNTYVPAGKQPEMIMGLYNESVEFLKKNKLLTIPPIAEETWRMIMMTPQRQLVNPFFTGGEVLSISYPTNTMTEEDKLMSMRGNNPHFSRSTVHHELIAGHHLQMFMNDRYKSYRNFNTAFSTEGWALYWELLLWDMKFPRSPEDRIGMLFWRMHRCARIIFSLNYHLGKWTPQQCIDFLVDRVGHERANAEGEVRRSFTGGYGPLYQLAYMIGGLQFYALKKDLVDNGKMSYQQFHDAVLQENNIPVELLRAILTNQKIGKDFSTSWKFYNKGF